MVRIGRPSWPAACSLVNPSRWHRTIGARNSLGQPVELCVDFRHRRLPRCISIAEPRFHLASSTLDFPPAGRCGSWPWPRREAQRRRASSPANRPGGSSQLRLARTRNVACEASSASCTSRKTSRQTPRDHRPVAFDECARTPRRSRRHRGRTGTVPEVLRPADFRARLRSRPCAGASSAPPRFSFVISFAPPITYGRYSCSTDAGGTPPTFLKSCIEK